jgi:hypothetical protein
MGLNRDLYPGYQDEPERVDIGGSFAPNGSSAVSAASNRGDRYWTVEYISTGLFRVTFNANAKFTAAQIIRMNHSLQHTTAAARFPQFGDYNATNRTLDIRIVDGSGNVQDVAANANNRISFELVVTTTNLTSTV